MKNSYLTKDILKFIIPSLVGVFFFLFPIRYGGKFTIGIAILVNVFNDVLAPVLTIISVILVTLSAVGSIVYKIARPNLKKSHKLLEECFNPTPVWLTGRIIGTIFIWMAYVGIGPELIISGDTGTFVLNDLLSTIIAILVIAGFLLPLLLEYGLMDFFGTLVTKIFRPLFKLPGRAAVDCLASWLGDASVAVVLTDSQYQEGYYSAREASVVITTFSAVSTTFCMVVIGQVGLSEAFIPFYLTVCIIGIVAGIIMPRIPPLSRKPDTYYNGVSRATSESIPENQTVFQYAFHQAIEKAKNGPSAQDVIKEGCASAAKITMGALPIVMTLGTFALILSTYTPIFNWLGTPFVPLLELLGVPEANAAANTLMPGFVDMFVPAMVAAATIESAFTKFVVAVVSVCQLIFLSQAGSLMLNAKTPVNVIDLFFIFLERTVISVILASLLARVLLPMFGLVYL